MKLFIIRVAAALVTINGLIVVSKTAIDLKKEYANQAEIRAAAKKRVDFLRTIKSPYPYNNPVIFFEK